MKSTSLAAKWCIIALKILSSEVYQAILDCAEAIAGSQGDEVLDLAHIERALDWLVLDK